ncbi:MAG: hypothetical protein GY851_07045 [bacterium]|nr:hypothetical protein [bacterium]
MVIRLYATTLLIAALAVSGMPAEADSVDVTEVVKRQNITPRMDHALETGDRWSPRSSTDWANDFTPHAKKTVNFGICRRTSWFRFNLSNPGTTRRELCVEVDNPRLRAVELHQLVGEGEVRTELSGTALPFHVRTIEYSNPSFDVVLEPGEERTCFLRVENKGSYRFRVFLWDAHAFNFNRAVTELLRGALYGALIMLALYNLLVFRVLKEWSFFLHACLIVSYVLWVMTMQGTAFQYLWPSATWWSDCAILTFMALTNGCLFAFSRSFLDTRKNAPFMDRVLLVFIVLSAAVLLAGMGGWLWPDLAAHIVAPVGMTCVLGAAIRCLVGGYRAARIFVAGWVAVLAGATVLGLVGFGFLPTTFLTENSIHLASIVALLLFSLAVADRAAIAERASRQRLEYEVERRTRQLTVALDDVKRLTGLLPICANCKKVRDDQGYWSRIETYLAENSDVSVSHGICPDCSRKLYGKDYNDPSRPPRDS